MSQHDFTIDNASGAAVRSDLNSALQALASLSAGVAAPSPTFANQLWVDTTNSLLKKRNNANSAWVTLGAMDGLIATTALSGLVTALATTTEVLTASNATKAVTPDALAALWEKGADIASASTISIGEGRVFHVTGTTGITDVDFATDHSGRGAWLIFDGALTLTHNATTLILPTGASIATAAGDSAFFVSENGVDNIRCLLYQRADGTPLVAAASVSAASQAQQETGSATNVYVSPGRQQFHPSSVKAWVFVSNSGTPTISASYNMTSLTDNAVGDITAVWNVDFSSANYAYDGCARATASNRTAIVSQSEASGPAAGTCRFRTLTVENSAQVDTDCSFWAAGDQ